MSTNKRPQSLTQLVYVDTKNFTQSFAAKYRPQFNNYSLQIYNKLLQCYQNNITVETAESLDSNAMLAYYACYKGVLRQTKAVNKKLSEEGLSNEIRLKQCIQVKSNFSKTAEEFEQHHKQCLESYRDTYEALYSSAYKDYALDSQKKE